MTLISICVVAAGGAIGAVARYGVSHLIAVWSRTSFPLGTFLVNAIGCLVMGFLMAGATRIVQHPRVELLLVTGLLGAFTTFSTFSLETVILFQRGSYGAAVANVVLSIAIGLAALVCGGLLARVLARIV
jgi:CrcB protein